MPPLAQFYPPPDPYPRPATIPVPQYDYSCGQFSPDGRVFQVEYAQKAVENSGTAIGIKCKGE